MFFPLFYEESSCCSSPIFVKPTCSITKIEEKQRDTHSLTLFFYSFWSNSSNERYVTSIRDLFYRLEENNEEKRKRFYYKIIPLSPLPVDGQYIEEMQKNICSYLNIQNSSEEFATLSTYQDLLSKSIIQFFNRDQKNGAEELSYAIAARFICLYLKPFPEIINKKNLKEILTFSNIEKSLLSLGLDNKKIDEMIKKIKRLEKSNNIAIKKNCAAYKKSLSIAIVNSTAYIHKAESFKCHIDSLETLLDQEIETLQYYREVKNEEELTTFRNSLLSKKEIDSFEKIKNKIVSDLYKKTKKYKKLDELISVKTVLNHSFDECFSIYLFQSKDLLKEKRKWGVYKTL